MFLLDIEDIAAYLEVKRHYEAETLRKRLGQIREYTAYCSTFNISIESSVEKFILYKKKNIKNISINEYIKCFRILDQYFIDRNISINLSKNLKRFDDDTEEKDPFTTEELKILLSYSQVSDRPCHRDKQEYNNNLYKDITLFIAMTGLRYSDVMDLKINDIHDNKIRFRQQKTGKYATCFILEPLLSVINKRVSLPHMSERIFESNKGTAVLRTKYNDWLKENGRHGSIRDYQKRCHAHNLRHTFALLLLKNKVDLRSIQLLMGHTNINTTAGYLELDDSHLQQEAKNHPLAKIFLSPVDVMKDIIESIKTFKLDSDKRFKFKLIEEVNKISFEVEIIDS